MTKRTEIADIRGARLVALWLGLVGLLVGLFAWLSGGSLGVAALREGLLGDVWPSPRAVYVDLKLPWSTPGEHSERHAKPISRELGRLKGVRQVLAAVHHERVVFAFVLESPKDANATVLQAKRAAQSMVSTSPSDADGRGHVQVFTKALDRPFLGVNHLDAKQRVGLTPFEQLQFEFAQLFGDTSDDFSLKSRGLGILERLAPDFTLYVSAASIEAPEDSRAMQGRMLALIERMRTDTRNMTHVQNVVVRGLTMRSVDLSFSGLELLRQGMTAAALARDVAMHDEAGVSDQLRPPTLFRRGGTTALGSGAPRSLGDLLDTPTTAKRDVEGQVKSGADGPRLQELVQVRTGYRMLVGALGQPLSRWDDVSLRPSDVARFKQDPLETLAEIGFFLGDDRKAAAAERQIHDWMNTARQDFPELVLEFSSPERGDAGVLSQPAAHLRQIMFGVALVLCLGSLLWPGRGSFLGFIRSFGVGMFFLSGALLLLSLDLRPQWLLTSLGLLALSSAAVQLPLLHQTKGASAKTRRILWVPAFLGLLTLALWAAVKIFGHQNSWSEQHHLLYLSLASLAALLSQIVHWTLPYLTQSTGGLVDHDEAHRVSRWSWIGYFCFVVVGAFGLRFWNIQPASPVLVGVVDGAEDDLARVPQLVQEAGRDMGGIMSLTAASARNVSAWRLRHASADARLDDGLLRDVIASQRPVSTSALIQDDGGSRLLVRLVDRDLQRSSDEDPLRAWWEQAYVPLAMTQTLPGHTLDPSAQALRSLRPLRDFVLPELVVAPSLKLLVDGVPSAFVVGVGPSVSLRDASARLGSVRKALLARLQTVGRSHEPWSMHGNDQGRQSEQHRGASFFGLLMVLVLGAGALFFGSIRGAFQTVLAFLVSHGIVSLFLALSYSFTETSSRVSFFEMQLGSSALALGLVAVWGRITAEANELRRGNHSIDALFVPFLRSSSYVHQWCFGLWSVSLVLSLSFYSFRFISCLLIIVALGVFVLPRWVYACTQIEESWHRVVLRARIVLAQAVLVMWSRVRRPRPTLGMGVFVLGLWVWSAEPAWAQSLASSRCSESRFVVLPIHNRPHSVEDPGSQNQVNSLLVSGLPCARLAWGMDKGLRDIMVKHRGPKQQALAVQALSAFVLEHRQDLLHLERPPPQEIADSAREMSVTGRVHVIAGYVQELFGHTSVVWLHLSPGGAIRTHQVILRTADLRTLPALVLEASEEDTDEGPLEIQHQRRQLIPVAMIHEDDPVGGGGSRVHGQPLSPLPEAMEDSLANRFEQVEAVGVLHRRPMFRAAERGDNPQHSLRVRVHQVGTRLYGSLRASDGENERSLLVEDDVTNLADFEGTMAAGAHRVLGSLTGVWQHAVLAGASLVLDADGLKTPLASAVYWRNLGQLAGHVRARGGEWRLRGAGEDRSQRAAIWTLGLGLGWLAWDRPGVVTELGLGFDAGPLSSNPRRLFGSGGPYAQTLFHVASGWTIMLRLGAAMAAEQESDLEVLGYQAEAVMGIGYSF